MVAARRKLTDDIRRSKARQGIRTGASRRRYRRCLFIAHKCGSGKMQVLAGLEQLSLSQIANQGQVGLEKIVLRKTGGDCPLDIAENAILNISLILAHHEEA